MAVLWITFGIIGHLWMNYEIHNPAIRLSVKQAEKCFTLTG
jgi:hypothetical protein